MIFRDTPLDGAVVFVPEPLVDNRGSFARTFDAAEIARRGLDPTVVECSISTNSHAQTLRGMHYQEEPWAERKIVSCVRGAIFDVIIDLRRDSPTFRSWFGIELSAENLWSLYVPKGYAHGFQTLVDDSVVMYMMSQVHVPSAAQGVRWDDPAFGIAWPVAEERIIAERDRRYEDFT